MKFAWSITEPVPMLHGCEPRRPSSWQPWRSRPPHAPTLRLALGGGFFLRLGNQLRLNYLDVKSDSKLTEDLRSPNPEVRRLLGAPGDHAVDVFEYALLYDTRDNEEAPRSGQYHEASLRWS